MASENKDKLKALQLTLDRIDKTYGKGTVMKLGDEAVETVSYTHLTLPTKRIV